MPFSDSTRAGTPLPAPKQRIETAGVCVRVVLLSGMALATSLVLEPLIEPDFSPLFLGAVAVSTSRWGVKAGVLSTLLGAAALIPLFLPPHYTLDLWSWAVLFRECSYLMTATLIMFLVERFLRAERGLSDSLAGIRAREERLRVALLRSPITVFHQDTDLRYLWVYNPFPEHDSTILVGKTDSDLFPAEEAENLTRIKRAVLQSGVGVRREVELTTRGKRRTLDASVEAFRDSNGKVAGILGTAVDITDRRRHQEQLKMSRDRFRELAAHVQRTREAERTLTSREIELNVGQMLTALNLELSMVTHNFSDTSISAGTLERMRAISDELAGTIDWADRASGALKTSVLEHLGLAAAVESEARTLRSRTGARVHVGRVETNSVSPEFSLQLFRIVQERLLNLAQCESLTQVEISLEEHRGTLLLQVRDNGLQSADRRDECALETLAIEERARELGGSAKLLTTPGGSFLRVEIPTPENVTA